LNIFGFKCNYNTELAKKQVEAAPKKGVHNMLDKICLTLAIIGGLNWGSIGLFGFDIVAWIFGGQNALFSRIIYTVIALAAVWCISLLFRNDTEHSHSSAH
jgi:uncharacterized membrane protein YuzA (DUF378 family)